MPFRIGPILVINRSLAAFAWLLTAGSLAMIILVVGVRGEPFDDGSVFFLIFGAVTFLAPVVWVGDSSACWLEAPWMRVRYRDVTEFEMPEGDWCFAELRSGKRRRVVPPGGFLTDGAACSERRRAFVLAAVRDAAADASVGG
jgi:hypothetical protein